MALTIRRDLVPLLVFALWLVGGSYVLSQGYKPPAGSGGGIPTDTEVITASTCASCSAERVVTDVLNGQPARASGAGIVWDVGTAGQLKATALALPRPNTRRWSAISQAWDAAGFAPYLVGAGTFAGRVYNDATTCSVTTSPADATDGATLGWLCNLSGEIVEFSNGFSGGYVYGGRVFHVQGYFKFDDVDVNFYFGIQSGTGTAVTASRDPTLYIAQIAYSDTAADTNFQCVTNDNSGGGTITDSTVAVDANSHEFDIVGDGGSNVYFYIDGTLRCTNTTNLPSAGAMALFFAFSSTVTENITFYPYHTYVEFDR